MIDFSITATDTPCAFTIASLSFLSNCTALPCAASLASFAYASKTASSRRVRATLAAL